MKLFEMEGFLRGKCLPGDMKVNETNAEYLVRKFAEADARCAALAAELRAVEAIHNEAVFITDDRYEQCPPEVQKIIRSLAVMQIPAYHAFLAEVRAQGVEMAAKSDQFSTWVQQGLRSFAIGVRQGDECADELRKGVQS